MLKKINTNDLEKFINKYQVKRGVESINICQTACDVLRKVFNVPSGSFSVASFKDGVLSIKAANSSLLQELKFRESQIIDLILDKAPEVNLNRVVGRIS